MMKERKDGGAAFPRPAVEDRSHGDLPDGNGYFHAQDGMTLRDYFAAKAMQGLLISGYYCTDSANLAKLAHKHADALLAHRENSNGKEG